MVHDAVHDGSGTGGEVETPTEKMEASSVFECSALCSMHPADSDFTEMIGFESKGHIAGNSQICRGHPAEKAGCVKISIRRSINNNIFPSTLLLIFGYVMRLMATTQCGTWSPQIKEKQCATSTLSQEDVLLDEEGFFSALMTSGSFTMMQAGSFEP